ncbi:energy-coupled thiamine transporter ThiT [Jeotgalibaca porci]|uniref:Energy-coupled thiamine transporter ThiT n=1 Tax=Jeotgalibaca porci TaxID=1868793 RepID=A0A6G7WJU4_9LACT|nr:energy-coupled thiamine transporter ThiT [Jeotgalibaca porci]QIK52451.1 energy-coupled thiamine transporter ThiT [Jeotgalibaca porci]
MSKNLTIWIEATIMAALATALSFIPLEIGPSFTITVGQPVLILFALRRGLVPGLAASFLWGIMHIFVANAYILTPLQGFIEYFVAFGFSGFAGLWANSLQSNADEGNKARVRVLIVVGSIVGTAARFFWHTIAGYYFWGEYAPENWSPWFYTIVMNGASAFATATFTVIVLLIIFRTTPSLFVPKNKKYGY